MSARLFVNLLLITGFLFLLQTPGTAENFVNTLPTGQNGWGGWQPKSGSQLKLSEGKLIASAGKSVLSFDHLQSQAEFSLSMQTTATFKGKVTLVLSEPNRTTKYELIPTCCGDRSIPIQHHFKLQPTSVEWKIDNNPLKTDYRQPGEPVQVALHFDVKTGESATIQNLKLVEHGFSSLFNGTDLTGWEGAGQPAEVCWKVENGELICTGLKKGPWLRSAKSYGDFNLRLEYWVSNAGNSGLFIRVPENGKHHRKTADLPEAGFEIQLLDDADAKYRELKDYQYTGSIYDIVGASQHVGKPAGEWNTIELNCKGQHVVSIHNGVKIVDATDAQYPLLSLRKIEGYLGLQNHSSVVKFRNLRIGPPQP